MICTAQPAVDLNGTACDLYGFEACRKVFDIAGDSPVLVEEIGGPDAEAMAVAGVAGAEAALEADTEPEPVVVAVTEGVVVELETAGPETDIPAETPVAAVPDAPAEATVAAALDPVTAPVVVAEGDEVGGEAGPEVATEQETLTIAAVSPDVAVPAEPVPPAAGADEGPEGTEEAAASETDNADEDGPTSRHDAGPAPAVPATAAFRGDGTLILPDVALQ